jgi:hypothetical protein
MATRGVLAEEQLARLRGFPEISQVELLRYFTLTAADEEFVREFRRPSNVFGVAVQLCVLPRLGYVPNTEITPGSPQVTGPQVNNPGAPGY